MFPVEFIALGLLVAIVLLIVWVAVRRTLLTRGGGIDVCWRTDLRGNGSGWTLGQARYAGDVLLMFRSFAVLPTASRTLQRQSLVLGGRRAAIGAESDLLPAGAVIVRCTNSRGGRREWELAMSEESLTGLRSWLESAPTAHRGRTPGQA